MNNIKCMQYWTASPTMGSESTVLENNSNRGGGRNDSSLLVTVVLRAPENWAAVSVVCEPTPLPEERSTHHSKLFACHGGTCKPDNHRSGRDP